MYLEDYCKIQVLSSNAKNNGWPFGSLRKGLVLDLWVAQDGTAYYKYPGTMLWQLNNARFKYEYVGRLD